MVHVMTPAARYTFPIYLAMTVTVCSVGCNQMPHDPDLAAFLSRGGEQPRRGLLNPAASPPAPTAATRTAYVGAFQAAREIERSGRPASAIDRYQELVRQHPEQPEAHHRLAVLCDQYGRHDEAANHYLHALRLAPDDAQLMCDYGYSRYLQGDLLLAERFLRQSVQLNPNSPRAQNNLGLVLLRQGRESEALAAFARSGLDESAARQRMAEALAASRMSTNTSL